MRTTRPEQREGIRPLTIEEIGAVAGGLTMSSSCCSFSLASVIKCFIGNLFSSLFGCSSRTV